MNRSFLFLVFLIISSCASYEPFYSDEVDDWQSEYPPVSVDPDYSLFLIGDSRSAHTNPASLTILENQLSKAGENSAVIFLGDNGYPNGLPDSTDKSWDQAEKSLLAQLKILQNYEGEVIYIPGSHDWAHGRKEGLEYVRNQRKYIENYLDQSKIFLPKKGSPGPTEVKLTDDIVVILIDSYWWFHEKVIIYLLTLSLNQSTFS